MDQKDAIDWNNKCYALAGRGQLHEALAAIDHAISLDASNPVFYRNRERILIKLTGQKNAKPDISENKDTPEQTHKSKLDYAIWWNNKAWHLYQQGEFREAINAFDRAISLDPTQPIFWKNKAKALKAAGKDSESEIAQELFESIKDQKNFYPSEEAISWNNKGYSLAEKGDHAGAIDAFNRAIGVYPNFADAYNNLGFSMAELGRIDEAIAACYHAVELDPKFAYPWIERLLFLPELVQYQEKNWSSDNERTSK
jgi:tetratricopeptide (TPR) repeat protein